jgi:hypothetical protein
MEMGKVESTNKFFVNLIIKLVSENKANWDEHLPTMFFSYKKSYKITMNYTPYLLIYALHPFMPIKYVLPTCSGDHRNANHVKVLTSRLTNLEKIE